MNRTKQYKVPPKATRIPAKFVHQHHPMYDQCFVNVLPAHQRRRQCPQNVAFILVSISPFPQNLLGNFNLLLWNYFIV